MWVLSPYTLPCGLVTVDLPHAWELVEQGYHDATFECELGRVSINCMPSERPDLIASGKFEELFWDFLSKESFEQMMPWLARWWAQDGGNPVTLSDREEADDGELFRPVWRQIQICRPHHVRRLTWQFAPNSRSDGRELGDFTTELDEVVVPRTQFAKSLTEFDRVAPSPTLKMISLGDTIYMRVPPDWKLERENEDGTGRYVIDEPEFDRWTLWLDWNQFRSKTPPRDDAEIREVIDANVQQMSEVFRSGTKEVKPGIGHDRLLVQRVTEDGLETTNWNRIAILGERMLFVHFSFNVTEGEAGKPDIVVIRDLIEREAINAVLVPRQGPEEG